METQTRERAQGRDDGIETGTTAMGAACESRVPARVLLSSSLPCTPESANGHSGHAGKKDDLQNLSELRGTRR
jgi:hypothetical protein